jgi:predicted Zn-ribbon and HTH transcriptional regulator
MSTLFKYKIISPKLITGKDYGLKHIEVRGFTFKELRAIASSNVKLWNTNAILEYYGKSGVIKLVKPDESLESIEILNKDDLFILMYFVNILTSPDFKISYGVKCPECGKRIDFDVTIDNIEYEEREIPDVIPIYFPNFKANLKRLNLKEINEVDIFLEKMQGTEYETYDKSDIVVALMLNPENISEEVKKLIDEQVKEDDEFKKIKIGLLLLDTLNLTDIQKLAKTIKSMEPKIKPFPIKCKCGFKGTSTIELDIKDILPSDGLEILNEFRNLPK